MDELDGLSATTLLSTASDWISALTVPPPVSASTNANSPHDKGVRHEPSNRQPENPNETAPVAHRRRNSLLQKSHKYTKTLYEKVHS